MQLNELRTANDLLDDAHSLAARYEHDGSLLVQGALENTVDVASGGRISRLLSAAEAYVSCHHPARNRWTARRGADQPSPLSRYARPVANCSGVVYAAS